MAIIKRNYDPKAAVELYNSCPHEMGTAEIMKIFKVKKVTAGKLKEPARKLMAEREIFPTRRGMVNKKCLYEAHGIDIEEAEEYLAKLEKRGYYKQPENADVKPDLKVVQGAAK